IRRARPTPASPATGRVPMCARCSAAGRGLGRRVRHRPSGRDPRLNGGALLPVRPTPMTRDEARRFLEDMFDRLFDPAASAEAVGAFFAPDYVQEVDGKRLDYSAFLDHVRLLKRTLERASVTFEQLLVDGSTIADIHVVDAHKKNGERLRVKVLA